MNRQGYRPELFEAMEALGARNRTAAAPADLERRLLAEFDARPHRAPSALRWRLSFGIALAAICLAAGALVYMPTPLSRGGGIAAASDDRPFAAVPYVAPIGPYERVEIVRMDVPVSVLIAAGFEVHLSGASTALPAEVLVGQDGRALAIRLFPNMQL